MRRAPAGFREKPEYIMNPMLIILLAAAFVLMGVVLVLSMPEKEVPLTLNEMVLAKMAQATDATNYSLVVEESGPGYSLRFSGQVVDDKIYGKIAAYELEVFSVRDTYFVRGEDLFNEWEEMSVAELGALSAIVHQPLDLLDILLTMYDDVVIEEGSVRIVDSVECQTYFVQVPPPELQLLTRFDDEEATLDNLQLYLWYNEEEEFLYRMAVLLDVTVEDEQLQINRIYNMNPDAPALPEDVPKPDPDYLAI